jgi:hypothetical protein
MVESALGSQPICMTRFPSSAKAAARLLVHGGFSYAAFSVYRKLYHIVLSVSKDKKTAVSRQIRLFIVYKSAIPQLSSQACFDVRLVKKDIRF